MINLIVLINLNNKKKKKKNYEYNIYLSERGAKEVFNFF